VVDFGFHLHRLGLELLQLVLERVDVALEFLDLVVEHELELLQLLVLALLLFDGLVFVLDCGFALGDVLLDVFDLVFEL